MDGCKSVSGIFILDGHRWRGESRGRTALVGDVNKYIDICKLERLLKHLIGYIFMIHHNVPNMHHNNVVPKVFV